MGQDAFVTLDQFVAFGLDPIAPLNDRGPLAGRQDELDAVISATDRQTSWPSVVLVSGPGGCGKTRLLREVLLRAQERDPQIPIVVLSRGMPLDAVAIQDLPPEPSIVVVDDAHADPSALTLLTSYARQTPGTQLVLATRPIGLAEVKRQVADAYGPEQIYVVQLGLLDQSDAIELVRGLEREAGLDLNWQFANYLADQARHSPHVAVIAINLMAQGQLRDGPAVSDALRERVLGRYVDVMAGGSSGERSEDAQRVLAVYSALGPLDDGLALESISAALPGLARRRLLTIISDLKDRGVLVQTGDGVRVVPDILADEVLEQESVIAGQDSGFVADLWREFHASHGRTLLRSLADLDWRLTRRGLPSVIDAVWQDVRTTLLDRDLDTAHEFLNQLGRIATTQPKPFLDVLDELRLRLDRIDGPHLHDENPTGTAAHDRQTPAPIGQLPSRAEYWLDPVEPDQIRDQLASLYGQCAVAEPALLEAALDALWALRRTNNIRANSGSHPERVVTEIIANLGNRPEQSFPDRILDRVTHWISEPAFESDTATPLFPLAGLVVKQSMSFRQSSSREFQIRGYFVEPADVASLRRRIRGLLTSVATGEDLRRVSAAIVLLGAMLRPPHENTALSPTTVQILGWADDDLETVAALRSIAGQTSRAVVRRHVRGQLGWTAERAESIPVRHAALQLVIELDDRAEDDLADLLLSAEMIGATHHRRHALPSLGELEERVSQAHEIAGALDPGRRSAAKDAEARARIDARRRDLDQRRAEAAQELLRSCSRRMTKRSSRSWIRRRATSEP